MNILTRTITAVDRFHYAWVEDDIDTLQDTCAALRGIGMGGSVAFADVANTIDVHRGELGRIARRLRDRGLTPDEYPMGLLEAALWALGAAGLAAWSLAALFGGPLA